MNVYKLIGMVCRAILMGYLSIGVAACSFAQPTLFAYTPYPTANRRAIPTSAARSTFAPRTTSPGITETAAVTAPTTATVQLSTRTPTATRTRPTEAVDPLACLPDEIRQENSSAVGLVSWVQDGQTVVIDFQGERRSVRLLGLDSPPIAERMLRTLLENQVAYVFQDPNRAIQNAADGTPYGYVVTVDGSFINFEMLHLGEARLDNTVQGYACQQVFQTAEANAKNALVGLWGVQAANPLPTGAALPTRPQTFNTPASSTEIALAPTPTSSQAPTTPGAPTATLAPGVTPSATLTGGAQTPQLTATTPTTPGAATTEAPTTEPTQPRPNNPTSTATPSGEGFSDVDVEIFNIFWSGDPEKDQANEYIELFNTGSENFNLGGWSVYSDDTGLDVYFPNGFTLAPGAYCRVYTNEIHPDSCSGLSFESEDEVWPDQSSCGSLWNDNEDYVAGYCYE